MTFPLVLLGCLAGGAEAQTVLNGSFETGLDPNTGVGLNIGMTAPDNTTIFGWTVSSGTVDYIGGRWVAGEGARSLDLSGVSAGSIFQTVGGLTPGVAYELSFLMAANPDGGAPTKGMQVDIGGVSQSFSATQTGNPADLGWTLRTLEFVPAAPTVTLVFTSLDNSASGPALDRVGIVQIPEPASWTLLILGGAGLGFRSWRNGTPGVRPGKLTPATASPRSIPPRP